MHDGPQAWLPGCLEAAAAQGADQWRFAVAALDRIDQLRGAAVWTQLGPQSQAVVQLVADERLRPAPQHRE
jgi:hypothetical protein